MHTGTTNNASQKEVAILARVFGNGEDKLPANVARYILTLGFGEGDKARMHDLAVGNQDDALSTPEKEELAALQNQ